MTFYVNPLRNAFFFVENSLKSAYYTCLLHHSLSLFDDGFLEMCVYFNSLQVGERIRVILDCEDNTLSFERNYEFLGVAFRGK